jgi:hypothetical protein
MNAVSAPSPLLDYTLRYNLRKEIIDSTKLRDIEKDAELQKVKLLTLQNEKRLLQDRKFEEHIEEIKKYESLKLTKEYQDYRYLYNLGTKVDMYI